MNPAWSERNLTPTSTAFGSFSPASVKELSQIEQGQVRGVTLTVMPAPGVSRLALSSAARVLIVAGPVAPGVQE